MHPGEILFEEFMLPAGLSQNKLAIALAISPRRINKIVNGKRSITADTAIRLAQYFGNSEQFWMNLQSFYELEAVAMEQRERILLEVHPASQDSKQAAITKQSVVRL
ncbi:MAG: HigA family addiction module antitoxin [Bacteroidota bacterium]